MAAFLDCIHASVYSNLGRMAFASRESKGLMEESASMFANTSAAGSVQSIKLVVYIQGWSNIFEHSLCPACVAGLLVVLEGFKELIVSCLQQDSR